MMSQGPVRTVRVSFVLVSVTVMVLILAEIATIVWVAGEIGWWTLAILGVTTLLGILLLQREWRKAWGSLSESLRSGQMPAGTLADTSLVLIGGILLLLPGLLTDVLGLLLLLPFTRPFVRSALAWWASAALKKNGDAGAPTVIRGDVVPGNDATPNPGTLIPEIEERDDPDQ